MLQIQRFDILNEQFQIVDRQQVMQKVKTTPVEAYYSLRKQV